MHDFFRSSSKTSSFSMVHALQSLYELKNKKMDHGQKKSNSIRGFAAMDAEKRREVTKKGGEALHQSELEFKKEGIQFLPRGFAAMDEATRKRIASKGGSSSRRNRIDLKEEGGL